MDSTSTSAEVLAAIQDNASYAEDSSVAKCRAYITAMEFYLLSAPQRSAHGGRGGLELELNTDMLARRLTAAKRWLYANVGVGSGGAGVIHVDLSGFRD